jgi:flagellar hook-length control protein FliK
MNMMQNLPFLVAQANPVKNAMTSKQPTMQAEKAEGSNSFKQVLSKQVEQDASKKSLDQSNSTKNKENDKPAANDVSDEPNVEAGAENSLDKVADAKKKELNKKIAADALNNSEVDKTAVDAQLLASSVTAKTIKDATDGEVVLDTSTSEDPTFNTLPKADASQNIAASFTPLMEATKKIAVDEKNVSLDEVDLKPMVKDVDVATKDKAAELKDVKAVESADDFPAKPKDAIAENDQLANRKFANVLAEEKSARPGQESLRSQSLSGVSDVSALSTMSVQNATKPLSQAMPLAQAGLSNVINVEPGKSGWSEAIGQKVVWMVGAAEQSATLTLNPKDLGPLQIIINVNNEKADATFISENPEVRKALEDGMSNLRQSMSQAGVELGQANVNTSKQQQDFQQASKEYAARQNQSNDNNASLDANTMLHAPVNTRVSNGLVDTFV